MSYKVHICLFRYIIVWILEVSLLLTRKCIIRVYGVLYEEGSVAIFEWLKDMPSILAIFV
jgi:hypothetical protein